MELATDCPRTVWQPAPLHPREEERLASLRDLGLLGTEPEPAYDRICQLAQTFLGAPIALVALINEDYSFFKSCVGASLPGIAKDDGPCGYALLQHDPLVIPDMLADPKFAACPVAISPLGIRFYAGMPLFDDQNLPLGTLCVLDTTPQRPDEAWIAAFVKLGAIVQDELALARSHRRIESAFLDLQSSESRYTSLVSTVPGVVYRMVRTSKGDLRYAFVSEGIRDLCGLEVDEYLKLDEEGGTMIHPDDQSRFEACFHASARTLEPVQWQGRMQARAERLRWVQTTARPEVAEDGAITWSGIITDIGALKAAEAEIREMNRTLEDRVESRTQALREAQVEMLTRLGLAAEARDDDTGSHIARVARTSGILARGAGLSESECEMIRQASPMHDIGKISIPDSILLKPAKLDDDEFRTMRLHAAEGARMLEGGTTELVRMAETIARSHHERWDGTGYPEGLRGEEIPLVGRIVAVADVFDALTSERPYKRAWSVEDAAEEIRCGAGSQFDPALVMVFLHSLGQIVGAESDQERLAA